jgi:hypothetical protein
MKTSGAVQMGPIKKFFIIFGLDGKGILAETVLLACMLVSLAIPAFSGPVIIWQLIPILSYIRATIWLVGATLFPGLYLLRLLNLSARIPSLTRLALSVILSYIIVSILALVLFYLKSLAILPLTLLLFLIISLVAFLIRKHNKKDDTNPDQSIKLSRWLILLLVTLTVSVLISLAVSISQSYLIPGDRWIEVKAAIEIMSGRDIFAIWNQDYPLIFGFTVAGYSCLLGLPPLNTNVVITAFNFINGLIFFVLVREVFNLPEKQSVIATIVYSFTGGFAWFYSLIVRSPYGATLPFWTASYLTQDAYFVDSFWWQFDFSYKVLALTMAFSSIILLTMALSNKGKLRGALPLLFLSSFTVLFAFFTHMIELLVFLPIIFVVICFSLGIKNFLKVLGIYALLSAIIYFAIDFLCKGYYSFLSWNKIIVALLSSVKPYEIVIGVIGVAIFPVLVYLVKRKLSGKVASDAPKIIKFSVVAMLITIYFVGLYIVSNAPYPTEILYLLNTFPWYYYSTRFGITLLLAFLGIGLWRWTTRPFFLAATWCAVTFLLGNIFLGQRTSSYIFPILAILGGITLDKALSYSASLIGRFNGLRIKLAGAAICLLVVLTIVSSSTSLAYGVSYYTEGPSMTDEQADLFSWVNQNTQPNSTILVSTNNYAIWLGTITIADRLVMTYDEFTSLTLNMSRAEAIYFLGSKGVHYAITVADESIPINVQFALALSKVVYSSGPFRVYEIPNFTPPTVSFDTVVILKQPNGFLGNLSMLGWIDDNFTVGWDYLNVQAHSDGQILSFSTIFSPNSTTEPLGHVFFSAINTTIYPYLIVRYQNPLSSNISVGQIISLRNGTWFGFITNVYLPTSNEWTISITKLPLNSTVGDITLWMRNYENLTGKASIEIDYIGLSSSYLFDTELNSKFELGCIGLALLSPFKYTEIQDDAVALPPAKVLISCYDSNTEEMILSQTNKTFVIVDAGQAEIPLLQHSILKDEGNGILSTYYNGNRVFLLNLTNFTEISLQSKHLYELLLGL